jgi:hypothetical protein
MTARQKAMNLTKQAILVSNHNRLMAVETVKQATLVFNHDKMMTIDVTKRSVVKNAAMTATLTKKESKRIWVGAALQLMYYSVHSFRTNLILCLFLFLCVSLIQIQNLHAAAIKTKPK